MFGTTPPPPNPEDLVMYRIPNWYTIHPYMNAKPWSRDLVGKPYPTTNYDALRWGKNLLNFDPAKLPEQAGRIVGYTQRLLTDLYECDEVCACEREDCDCEREK